MNRWWWMVGKFRSQIDYIRWILVSQYRRQRKEKERKRILTYYPYLHSKFIIKWIFLSFFHSFEKNLLSSLSFVVVLYQKKNLRFLLRHHRISKPKKNPKKKITMILVVNLFFLLLICKKQRKNKRRTNFHYSLNLFFLCLFYSLSLLSFTFKIPLIFFSFISFF